MVEKIRAVLVLVVLLDDFIASLIHSLQVKVSAKFVKFRKTNFFKLSNSKHYFLYNYLETAYYTRIYLFWCCNLPIDRAFTFNINFAEIL